MHHHVLVCGKHVASVSRQISVRIRLFLTTHTHMADSSFTIDQVVNTMMKNTRKCICPRCGRQCSSRGDLSRHRCKPPHASGTPLLTTNDLQQEPDSRQNHGTDASHEYDCVTLFESDVDDDGNTTEVADADDYGNTVADLLTEDPPNDFSIIMET